MEHVEDLKIEHFAYKCARMRVLRERHYSHDTLGRVMNLSSKEVDRVMTAVESCPPPTTLLKDLYLESLEKAKIDTERSRIIRILESLGIPRKDNGIEYGYAYLLLRHKSDRQLDVDATLGNIFSSEHTTNEEADHLTKSIAAIDEAGDRYIEVLDTDQEDEALIKLQEKYDQMQEIRVRLAEKAVDLFY